jgi:hypothetical protein
MYAPVGVGGGVSAALPQAELVYDGTTHIPTHTETPSAPSYVSLPPATVPGTGGEESRYHLPSGTVPT